MQEAAKQSRRATATAGEFLSKIHDKNVTNVSDAVNFGFATSSDAFAAMIPRRFRPTSLLDLGCGTGNTVSACYRFLRDKKCLDKVVAVDACHEMTEVTARKLARFDDDPSPTEFQVLNAKVLTGLDEMDEMDETDEICAELPGGKASLIVFRRVIEDLAIPDRQRFLQRAADILEPGGRIIIDVPHPDPAVAGFYVGAGGTPGRDSRPIREAFRQTCDEKAFDECRAYARSLAQDAGLVVIGPTPEHSDRSVFFKDLDPVSIYVEQHSPIDWAKPLTRNDLFEVKAAYIEDSRIHFRGTARDTKSEVPRVFATLKHASTPALVTSPSAAVASPSSPGNSKSIVQKRKRKDMDKEEPDAVPNSEQEKSGGGKPRKKVRWNECISFID